MAAITLRGVADELALLLARVRAAIRIPTFHLLGF